MRAGRLQRACRPTRVDVRKRCFTSRIATQRRGFTPPAAGAKGDGRAPASPTDDSDRDSGTAWAFSSCGGTASIWSGTGSVPGFLAALWIGVDDGVGAVALANVTAGPMIGTIAADLVQNLIEREPRSTDVWQPLADVDPALLDLAGPWYWEPVPVIMRVRAERALELAPLAGGDRRTRPDSWVATPGSARAG